MEEDKFKPGEVYLYLVEWSNEKTSFQVRALEENLTLGDIREIIELKGGDEKDDDYKSYYLDLKYMIYCEDENKNLVILSFAVDYRSISYGFSDAFRRFRENNADKIKKLKNNEKFWNDVKMHPGFVIPSNEEKKIYQNHVDVLKDEDWTLAEILFSEDLGKVVGDGIFEVSSKKVEEMALTPKCLAFSDVHGDVLSFIIGVGVMKELKKNHKDLITVCEGDAIGRKGNYYEGKKEPDAWGLGKFTDLTSIFIIYTIRQLVETAGSRFIYLHGNHDYAIEYPTIMSYTTNNYQLIFSHGMIHPQLLATDELQQITGDDDWTKTLIYPESLVGVPEVKIFAFSEGSIARGTRNNLFFNDNVTKDKEYKLVHILDKKNERPADNNEWKKLADKLKEVETRDYLSNYFFIMANKYRYDYSETISVRSLKEMNEALMMLNEFAIGEQVPENFNPIFTFGHDYSYEVWSYFAHQNKNASFPLNGEIWKNDYKWRKVQKARLEKHLMARVFCVDGLHYIDPNYENKNGPYAKINKYEDEIGDFHIVEEEDNDSNNDTKNSEIESGDLDGIINENEEEEENGEQNESDNHNSANVELEPNVKFIERELSNGEKSVLFKRGVLEIYRDNNSEEYHSSISGIDDNYLVDSEYLGTETFKLIVVAENIDETNVIYELFFDIHINEENHDKIIEKITATLSKWLENNNESPLFFIFSPSIYTLECFQGVLGCMTKYDEAYFIAMISPWSRSLFKEEYEENYMKKAQKYLTDIPYGNDKYIELLDLETEESYDNNGYNFERPTAIIIHLSKVDILVSKSIQSLDKGILYEDKLNFQNGDEIIKYYYKLDRVAAEVNKICPVDAPEIPMSRESLINLIKMNFVRQEKDYKLTFKPTSQEHIDTLQSCLKNEKKMALSSPITIQTDEVSTNNNAITHIYRVLLDVLKPNLTAHDLKQDFFQNEDSNPLILAYKSNYEHLFDTYKGKSLKEAIEFHDIKMEENDDATILSRTYSLCSVEQRIKWESEEMTENETNDTAAITDNKEDGGLFYGCGSNGGAVISKKKAIIISIILGAILIIVIVIVVIVTSRNEGFKPSIRQIKP